MCKADSFVELEGIYFTLLSAHVSIPITVHIREANLSIAIVQVLSIKSVAASKVAGQAKAVTKVLNTVIIAPCFINPDAIPIVRCAIRCGYRFVSETTPTATAEATGLKKSTLKQIPGVAYESELNTPVTECPICLGEFEQGEKFRILPKCNHGFHVKCVDKWLLLHSSCPLCRQPLLDQV
ncbi:hypothetical protein JCGZ_03511 [Jatropha curcas]|uniref:RING-type E3 ubiquitin transferase n=1 Tax=Jatropha curcas TaxID=180498 RepID=A0A067L652_JATCU|nr:hypothetical protein JCGZ_03511 [Jatropha curcas]